MEIIAVIARLHFQFAKTMPETPHEYTVKTADNEVDYIALFEAVREHGVRERYVSAKGRAYWTRYLYPRDGWRYWAMTTEVRQSHISNRARVAGDHEIVLERARAAGRLA
jgi:hypothetical protein